MPIEDAIQEIRDFMRKADLQRYNPRLYLALLVLLENAKNPTNLKNNL